MNKNKIIFTGVIIIALATLFALYQFGFKVVRLRESNPSSVVALPPIPKVNDTSSTPPILPKIVYTPNGKLDTSTWQEYRSEYGGFSVVAPKERANVGCYGSRYCEPKNTGEFFQYSLSETFSETYGSRQGFGIEGLDIFMIQKKDGTSLDNWMEKYIISGKEYLSDIQKTSLGKYPAMRFDSQTTKNNGDIKLRYSAYPAGDESTTDLEFPQQLPTRYFPTHFIIVDLGNRYALIAYTISVDKNIFYKNLTEMNPHTAQWSALLDNKTLSDIYQSILDSFQAFPPTKS